MKKTLLSLVLCVALLVSAVSAMVAMPASAADDISVLLGTTSVNIPGSEEPASATVTTNDDGSVTINFPKDDKSEVVFDCGEAGISVLSNPQVVVSVESTLAFDICFYDANNGKYIMCAGDYYPTFNEQVSGSNASQIVAGTYTDVKFDLSGAYKWNPEKGDMSGTVPDNAAIRTVAIVPKGTGSMTITKLVMSDGIEDVSLDTRGDVSDLTWDNTVNLLDNTFVDAPAESNGVTSNIKITENADGSLTFGNTAALWPFASCTFATPYVVNNGAALDMEFSVAAGCRTTIYFFLGSTTPDEFNSGEYVWVANPADVVTVELGAGNYSGVAFLEDYIAKTIFNMDAQDKAYNDEGKIVINGIKICAASDAAVDSAVTVKKLNLVYNDDSKPTVATTEKGATTTTTTKALVAPGGTTSAQGNTTAANNNGSTTTTANKGGSTGGNSAATGDASDAALFIVVAAAAAAVVISSVVASKKAQSR